MTELSTSAPEREIIAAIVADAECQAKAIIETAETAARIETGDTARATETDVADVRKVADRRARQNAAKTIANARVEAKRIMLRAREDALKAILSQVEGALRAIRSDPIRYRAALAHLLAEAVVGVNQGRVVAVVSAADKSALDGTLLDEVRTRAREVCGFDVVIELTFEKQDWGGGCTARSVDGHVSIDNTFGRRFTEAKTHLKALIAEKLVKNGG